MRGRSKLRGRKWIAWKKVKYEEESKKGVRENYFPPRSLISFALFLMGRKYVKVRKNIIPYFLIKPITCQAVFRLAGIYAHNS